MSVRRGRAARRRPNRAVSGHSSSRRWLGAWLALVVVTVAVAVAAEHTGHGRSIISSIQAFALFYAGVFALIGLTAIAVNGMVGAGIFVMPATVSALLGPSSPIAYLLATVAAMLTDAEADHAGTPSLSATPLPPQPPAPRPPVTSAGSTTHAADAAPSPRAP